ncbi:MAG: polyprenyl synthetase family protein [Dehalococcoidia bacterium]|nr:polyprenyl synthetase family protein [Dehalococcoidia bacterium]
MDKPALFQPIQQDLPEVERFIQSLARADTPWLSELLNYVLRPAGKRLRPALTLMAGQFYNYDRKRLLNMAAAVELLHTATLVHDDTIDEAEVRRGISTVNARWDGSMAVLAGDYLFAQSAVLAASTESMRVVQMFARTLMTIVNGEMQQQKSAFAWNQTREEYFQRIAKKTASLFSMATESGAVLSGAPEAAIDGLTAYGYNLGMAFQIVDDILDFMGEEEEMGKPVGNDLQHGTVTLPAMLYMEMHPDDDSIRRMLETPGDNGHAIAAIQAIRNSPAISEAYKVASGFCQEAKKSLSALPARGPLDTLKALTEYTVNRSH